MLHSPTDCRIPRIFKSVPELFNFMQPNSPSLRLLFHYRRSDDTEAEGHSLAETYRADVPLVPASDRSKIETKDAGNPNFEHLEPNSFETRFPQNSTV